jgi:hypothetical protein
LLMPESVPPLAFVPPFRYPGLERSGN